MTRIYGPLGVVFPGIVLAVAMAIRAHAAAAAKPNVLMIVTDDQGYGDLSIHGNPRLMTPHLDRLGESSVRFNGFTSTRIARPRGRPC